MISLTFYLTSDSVAFFNEHAQQVREILPSCLPQRREFLEFIAQHSDLLQQQTD